MQRLGILLSGRGSNFLAIAKAIGEHRLPGAEIAVVLSNIEDAPGLAAAHALNLPAFAIPSAGRKRAEHDAEMIARLHQHKVDLVCLAGYMRIISPAFVAAFPNRILNVHPSLLPAFPGPRRAEAGARLWSQGRWLHRSLCRRGRRSRRHHSAEDRACQRRRHRRDALCAHPRTGASRLSGGHRPRPWRSLHASGTAATCAATEADDRQHQDIK